ncbi:MAG: prolipoprotein diacylglyceryl transferase, partial [Elusimicrobia bacterium]|nr:prolipoprotein diacylglyceryl transferase [Elusimicrobiota bacterium]
TSLPRGVSFTDRRSLVPDALLGVKLHPSQLYESLGNLLVAGAVWGVLQRRLEGKARPGCAFMTYVLLYSVLRFLVEFTRADDRGGFLLGLSPAQWTAIALAAGVLVWNAVRPKESSA